MSQKYRQIGYRDTEREQRSESPKPQQPKGPAREGPRSPRMPEMGRVIKCAMCGGKLPLSFQEDELPPQCPHCSADLVCCKNCAHFNPAARFECEEPVTKRITPKDKRADCPFFQIRTMVEKIVSSSPKQTVDPRNAFESLFKR